MDSAVRVPRGEGSIPQYDAVCTGRMTEMHCTALPCPAPSLEAMKAENGGRGVVPRCLHVRDVIGLAYFVRFRSADWYAGHGVGCTCRLNGQLCMCVCVCVFCVCVCDREEIRFVKV